MKKFIKFSIGQDGVEREAYRHNMPFDEKNGLHKTEVELQQEGFLVEDADIPVPENNGKSATLCRALDGILYYEYTTIEMPEAERIKQLEQENTHLKSTQAEQNQAFSDFMDFYFSMNPNQS